MEKRDKWREFASSLDRRTPNTKIWKTIKQLDGRAAAAPPNAAVRFKGRAYHKPKALATEFNKQFTTIVRHKTDKETRILNRKLQKLEHNTMQFSENQVRKAIKSSSNSKAFGPDELCIQYLKNLGPAALSRLTAIIKIYECGHRTKYPIRKYPITKYRVPIHPNGHNSPCQYSPRQLKYPIED